VDQTNRNRLRILGARGRQTDFNEPILIVYFDVLSLHVTVKYLVCKIYRS